MKDIRRIKNRHSSTSSEDDIPLKYCITNNTGEYKNGGYLHEYKLEACEFCDRISNSRYKSLIHNAAHIIIPLIKQTIYNCDECLHSFTSQADLKCHLYAKHWNVIDDKTITHGKIKNKLTFETLKKMKSITKSLLGDLTTDCKVRLTVPDSTWLYTQSPGKVEPPIDVIHLVDDDPDNSDMYRNKYVFGKVKLNDMSNGVVSSTGEEKAVDSSVSGKINSRIVFEESLVDLDSTIERVGEDTERKYESVHFDDLVKSYKHECRYCNDICINKYQLCLHEATHIDFDIECRSRLCILCERYVAGNKTSLKMHIKQSHDDDKGPSKEWKKTRACRKCGLEYRSKRLHARNYHGDCELPNVVSKCRKLSQICDICIDFLRLRSGMSFVKVGSVSKEGKRYYCHICKRKFFELNLVRKFCVVKNKEESLVNGERIKKRKYTRKKLGKTNDQRLKNIQQRIKLLNKISKI